MKWDRFYRRSLLVLSGLVVLIQLFAWVASADMTTKKWQENRMKHFVAEPKDVNVRHVLLDVPPYEYDPGDNRDPFSPPDVSQTDSASVFESSGIEKSLGERVILVGIMFGAVGPRAFLRFEDGDEMIVGPGSPIARIQGRMKTITNQTVVIEMFSDQEEEKRSEKKHILRLNLLQSGKKP